jgi:NADPH:quinone reductase-like Zn-dependent oxidoreductase
MIPETMRALQIAAYDGNLELVEKPVPRPGPGQALVRMAAAPVNPSDLKFMRGTYGLKKPPPVVPGFEGSGMVVATGSGLRAKMVSGKPVCCLAPEDGDGTWAEYMLAEAAKCIPLQKGVSLEQGATMVVNPWTATAHLERARKGGHRAAVHTAAAGALGRMVLRLALRQGLPMVHVARYAGQVDELKGLGAEHVLSLEDEDFDEHLEELCRRLDATIAFDPIGGEMTGRVLAAMPKGSVAVVYGSLADAACAVRPERFIYERKRVEGFWLPRWVERKSLLGRIRMAMGVQKHLDEEFEVRLQARVGLEGAAEAIEVYKKDMDAGKVLLLPHGEEGLQVQA